MCIANFLFIFLRHSRFVILLLIVVNLTLIDLPGLTKVAVGTLSFHSSFSNI